MYTYIQKHIHGHLARFEFVKQISVSYSKYSILIFLYRL